MIRASVLILLACAIAGASPLSWTWDVFQPANPLTSPLANSYFTSIGDVATWLPATAALSNSYRNSSEGDETGAGVDGDLHGEGETIPNSLTPLDLSSLFSRPRIIGS